MDGIGRIASLQKTRTAPVVGMAPQYDRGPNRYSLLPEYAVYLAKAGAALVIIAPSDPNAAKSALQRCDGIIVPGGDDDVDPRLYGEKNEGKSAHPNRARDESEALLIRHALSWNMPFLGICRGMQMANVALGGSLYQSIEDGLEGALDHGGASFDDMTTHELDVIEGTPLSCVIGRRAMVNSAHRQGVKLLATDLEPMAYTNDGLVEAFWRPESSFFWGVQWHPEHDLNSNASSSLAAAFVDACRRYASKRTLEAAR